MKDFAVSDSLWFKEDWIQAKGLCYPKSLNPATSIWKDHDQKTAQLFRRALSSQQISGLGINSF